MWKFKWRKEKEHRPNDGDEMRERFEKNKAKIEERRMVKQRRVMAAYYEVLDKIRIDADNGYADGYYRVADSDLVEPVAGMLRANGFKTRDINRVREIYVSWSK